MGRQPRFADESSISRSFEIRADNLWLDARSLCAEEKHKTGKTAYKYVERPFWVSKRLSPPSAFGYSNMQAGLLIISLRRFSTVLFVCH